MFSPEPPYPLQAAERARTASCSIIVTGWKSIFILISDKLKAGIPAVRIRSPQPAGNPFAPAPCSCGLSARYACMLTALSAECFRLIDRLLRLSSPDRTSHRRRRYDGIVEHFGAPSYRPPSALAPAAEIHNPRSARTPTRPRRRRAAVSTAPSASANAEPRRRSPASSPARTFPEAFSLSSPLPEKMPPSPGQIAPHAAFHPNALRWRPPSAGTPHVVFRHQPRLNTDAGLPGARRNLAPCRARCPSSCARRRTRDRVRAPSPALPNGNVIEVTGPIPETPGRDCKRSNRGCSARAGGGMRIQILEAWLPNRCVVATPAAEDLAFGRTHRLAKAPPFLLPEVVRPLCDTAAQNVLQHIYTPIFESCLETVWKPSTTIRNLQPN